MSDRGSRSRWWFVRSASAVGFGAAAGYLLDPASGVARRASILSSVRGLIPGSLYGRGREEIAPGPPAGMHGPQDEIHGDPTGGAGFIQVAEFE
jgi:hypothetical protein